MPYVKRARGVGVIGVGALFLRFEECFLVFVQDLTQDLLLKFPLDAESRPAEMRSVFSDSGIVGFAGASWLGTGPGCGMGSLSEGCRNGIPAILAHTGIDSFSCIVAYRAVLSAKALQRRRPAPWFLLLPMFGTAVHFNIVGDDFHARFWMVVAMAHTYGSRPHGEVSESVMGVSAVPDAPGPLLAGHLFP
jgi:hypothetical protein